MKRFLLTLLGVAALCGLSPHHAAAQSVEKLSMDLGLRTADHNTKLTYTIDETQTAWFDTKPASPTTSSIGGFTKIENDTFLIEFDYFDLWTLSQASLKSNYTAAYGSKTKPGICLYPGTRFRISLKDPNKRI